MVGGQAADIQASGKMDLPDVEYIHTHKTGALILASVRIGAIAGAGSRANGRSPYTRCTDKIWRMHRPCLSDC